MIRKRALYSDDLQKMKTSFLAERSRFAQESDDKIRELGKEVNKVMKIYDFLIV